MDRRSAVLGCLLAVAALMGARASAQAVDAQGRPQPPPGYSYDPPATTIPNDLVWDKPVPPPGFVPDNSNGGHAAAERKLPPATDPATSYYERTIELATSCDGDPTNCYVQASPERCKQSAVQMMGNPDLFRRTWVMCVRSCGDAGLTSRVLGDCRR